LILVRPDNSWDLIMGTTRLTPEGLAVPKSLMGRGFENPTARQINSITRCGKIFYISLAARAGEDGLLRGEIWTSEDLHCWSKMSLPREIRTQNATLVSAVRNSSTTLLVIERQPGTGRIEEDLTLPVPEVPGLPRGVEFWRFKNGG